MTMFLTRLAILGAALCTLWFNGSYAYAKAAGDAHQIAMVAVALTIDLCKCAFLPAAAHLFTTGFVARAAVLVALWPLAFGWSLYSGYSSLTTNRSLANVSVEGDAQSRTRAQTDYDQATAALTTAKRSPLWEASAACTTPKTAAHKNFCDGVGRITQSQSTANTTLKASKPASVDPEITLIASITAIPRDRLLFWIAFAPALILELLSSFGAYAISATAVRPPRTPVKSFLSRLLPTPAPTQQNTPTPPPALPHTPPATPSAWIMKR